MLSLVTIAAVPEHRCFIEGVDTFNETAAWNSTEITDAIPLVKGVLDSCHMFVAGSNDTTTCSKYVYDDTYYKDTRSMDWNMVCDDRFRGAIAQTIYMLGVFTGAVTLGKSLKDHRNFFTNSLTARWPRWQSWAQESLLLVSHTSTDSRSRCCFRSWILHVPDCSFPLRNLRFSW